MEFQEYKPNSQLSKEKKEEDTPPERKVQKIVSGKVVQRKPSVMKKFADVFLAEDMGEVFWDVIMPSIKGGIADVLITTIQSLIGGSKRSSGSSSVINYNSIYRNIGYKSDDRVNRSGDRKAFFDLDDIVIETRGEAEDVLTNMEDIIDQYGSVKVSDLYDLVGLSAPYTMDRYGWTNLSRAYTERARDGYVLRLPKAQPLDR